MNEPKDSQLAPQPRVERTVERRVFTDELKREAVRLAEELGYSAQVARDLGLHQSVLLRWKRRLRTAPDNEVVFPGHGNAKDRELARLKRENRRLHEEVEIPEMAVGIFSACPRRPKPGRLCHSDRGSQYASADYQQRLEQAGIVCSMSHKGNCWDSAPTERLFGAFKRELVRRTRFAIRKQARAADFEWTEACYNRRRRRSALAYLSRE